MSNKKAIREKLYNRQSGFCLICGHRAFLSGKQAGRQVTKVFGLRWGDNGFRKKSRHLRATIEHIVPIDEGGSNAQTNLVMTHALCNSTRGTDRLNYHINCFKRLPKNKQKNIEKYNRKKDNELT